MSTIETARLEVAVRDFVTASNNLNEALKEQYSRFLKEGCSANQSHLLLRTAYLEILSLQKPGTFTKAHLRLVWGFWEAPDVEIQLDCLD
jgi:hypothetical protein